MKKASTFLLLLVLVSQEFIRSQVQTYMDIDFSKHGIAISPTLYGIFFEDINFAADGGLYAELIRNRSFEEGKIYWSLVRKNGSIGSMNIETQNLLNAAQTKCLKLTADSISPYGSIGIRNAGFWGINVVDKTGYEVSFFAKSNSGFNGIVTISLVNNDGSVEYAQQRIAKLTTVWQKYTCKLVAHGTDPIAKFSLSINAAGTVWFDVISLFPPTFHNRSNGLRKDLAQKLEDMHPGFMRFPGGCFVEGHTMIEAFRWKQTIGPIEERPGHQNFWGYRTSDGMGYHEFLQLCEDIGAEPLYVCNVGMSHNEQVSLANLNLWIQDALNAIEYANGDTTSTWGYKRKVNGHPAPFNLKYIEIGNEDWFEPYSSHYNMFYDSIKTYYPDITCISNVNWTSLNHIDMYDYHNYSSAEWFAQNANLFDNTDRKGPKVYVGEYAVTVSAGNGNLRSGVGEASFMTGLERNSDIVIKASYAPLFGNLNNCQWNPNAIYYNSSNSYGTPSYYVQKMFANNTGSKYVSIKDSLNVISNQFSFGGAIGVGTWSTQSQYDSITVISGDSTIINQNFDSDASGWNVYSGTWSVSNGIYQQTSNNTDCRSTYGNITLHKYTYHLKARKISGSEGFLIIFGAADNNNLFWWNIGGWSNTQAAIEQFVGGGKSQVLTTSNTINSNQWYDIRIEVNEDTVKCYLDNKIMFNFVTGIQKSLYNSCTVDTTNGDIFLKVVNFGSSDKLTNIKMTNLPKNTSLKGSIQTLTYATPLSENSINVPEKIVPSTTIFSSSDTGFIYTFQQNSVNIFHLVPQSSLMQLKSDTFSIPENSKNGFSAGKIKAIAGNNMKYSIISSIVTSAFDVVDTTGEIIVKDSSLLNFEVNPVILLSVSAKDSTTDTIPAARGTYTINLLDVNEKPTLIGSKYYAFVNDSAGSLVGEIFVQDEDRGQSYTYSIKSQSKTNLLSINSTTGELTINDNSTLSTLVSQTVTFTVDVVDNGTSPLSDEKDYILEILDKPILTLIKSRTFKNNLDIYPNPAGNYFTVKTGSSNENLIINIIDCKGTIVYNLRTKSNLTTIKTSNMPNGIYYLQVLSNGQVVGVQNVEILK